MEDSGGLVSLGECEAVCVCERERERERETKSGMIDNIR